MNALPALFMVDAKPQPLMLTRPSRAGGVAQLDFIAKESEENDGPLVDGEAEGRWKITGSPVVVVAAMKLFSGAKSGKRDAVSFPAVDGTFDDLLMLQHRYPMTLTAAAEPVWETHYLAAALRAGGGAAPIQRRRGAFTGSLLPFQEDGVAWMCAQRRGLLGDDMGLGKTVQAFAFLDRVQQWPALIVCQPHVQRHWERKLEEFLEVRPAGPGGGLYDIPPGTDAPPTWLSLMGAKAAADTPQADIYIVHYLVLHAWVPLLAARGIRTLIFDEVQELRHSGTRKYDCARLIARSCANVVGLSGTPTYNYGDEIYTVLNAISKGCLGTRVDFEKAWCGAVAGKTVVLDPDILGTYLRDARLLLRRTKAEVQSDLPEKRAVIEPIDANREEFANLVRAAAALAREAAATADPFDRARMEQEAINQTRRATGIAKVPAIIAFLRGLMEAGEPTLVFAHHHAVEDAIREALEEFSPGAITGQENTTQKEEGRRRFIEGETNLLIIALRAATGIDGLQARARCVVFAELDWSPAIHRQAEDRAHRMGQQESVIVYYLITDLGTDPDMMAVLNLKDHQFKGLMHEKSETTEDHEIAAQAAKEHMTSVLDMLRAVR